MIKNPIAFIICAVLISTVPVFGDTKPDTTFGPKGTKTTETSEHEGKTQTDTTYRDGKGTTRQTESEVSGPDGKVRTIEQFRPDGTKSSSDRTETDASGKITGGTTEKFNEQGVMISGTSWNTDANGKKHVKNWNPSTGQYEEGPPKKQKVEYVDGNGQLHQLIYDPNTGKYTDLNPPKYNEYENNQPKKPSALKLNADGKLEIITEGTGNTIGHVGDLKIKNLTSETVSCVVPAMVLESKNQQGQDVVCPESKTVSIPPGQTEVVPEDGSCLERNRPAVPQGAINQMICNDGDPAIPANPDSHIPQDKARHLVRIGQSIYQAVDKLQKDGAFKDFPIHDKQKQKDIARQWCPWMDPRISEITGNPPATEDDFKKVIYKQVEEKHPITPKTRKEIEKGAQSMWDGIKLASAEAKDFEQPDQYAQTGTVGQGGGGNTYEISDETGKDDETSPPPETKEKKKKKKGKTWPKPIQDWLDKAKAAFGAALDLKFAKDKYQGKLKDFFNTKQHYKDVKAQADKAREKADGLNPTQADKDNAANAEKELKKLEGALEKDYQKTPEGQEEFKKVVDAEKAFNDASAAEKQAGKDIDPDIKGDILNHDMMKEWEAENKAKKGIKGHW